MQIKILDSWLKEYLITEAKPQEIAKSLSLTSVSVERLVKLDADYLYDIEVTTNRVDLMSVIGLAREAAAVLTSQGAPAELKTLKDSKISLRSEQFPIQIENDERLVYRICAAILDVSTKESPKKISQRLEASGIRSLNNLVDVTNYVMREIGHPVHVFDLDALSTAKLHIRESKKGEKVKTLDNKEYSLLGEDIVMEDENGKIVDLLGIMGLANSVVSDRTKRILLFIDNNEPKHIRNTSMNLGVRTEAAILNEKGVDPELAINALYRAIELYQQIADGKVTSVVDIYPTKFPEVSVDVSLEKTNRILGEEIPPDKSENILRKLGFQTERKGDRITALVPSFRRNDVSIEEDLIEEISRVYGYHNLKSTLPYGSEESNLQTFNNFFYWEKRVKNAMKYWGFTEVYTYSLVSEDLYEGPLKEALAIKNPLSDEMKYLRSSLTPGLLKVIEENKKHKEIKIFEIANVYKRQQKSLPIETLTISAVIKSSNASFTEAKGIVEGLSSDMGISDLKFKKRSEGAGGASVYIGNELLGYIEPLSDDIVDFELDFEKLISFATLRKKYTPITKFPESTEDLAVVLAQDISTMDVIEEIKKGDNLVKEVSLLDRFGDARTFHITYQSSEKNITKEEVREVREKIKKILSVKFEATFK